MDKILIPVIRNVAPRLIAEDIVGIQPMAEPLKVEDVECTIKVRYYDKSWNVRNYQGKLIHDFCRGWLRYYGTEWIPESLWMKLKIKGL